MFARVSILEGDPARADEAVAYIREEIVPQARQLEGSRGILSLVDRATGSGTTITFWDSEEALRASEETADRMRGDAAAATESAIAAVERYEVVIDERSPKRDGGSLFGRVTTVEGDPGTVDEAIIYTREKLVPAARQLDGNHGLLTLIDRATGKGLTITFWESEEAMRATEEAANQLRDDATQTLGEDIVGVDRYEIVLDERF
jgi:heme-degrading monooxygenase HmoA